MIHLHQEKLSTKLQKEKRVVCTSIRNKIAEEKGHRYKEEMREGERGTRRKRKREKRSIEHTYLLLRLVCGDGKKCKIRY